MADWRNGLLASPRFQAFAAAFPFTRPIARAQAADLFDLCNGFVYSQILLACVDLGILEALQDHPQTASSLSRQLNFPLEGTERLLRGARAIRLVEDRSGGRYGLGERGAALLGNPSVLDMIRHHRHFYQDLADPVELLRNRPVDSALSRFWGYSRPEGATAVSEDVAAPYSALMARTQGFIADEVLTAFPFHRYRHVLDIGGGSGAFAMALADAVPHLHATIFDLPEVAALATSAFEAAGVNDRCKAIGGDAFRGPLPTHADLITLVRILHDHDDDRIRLLLKRIRATMAPDATLIIAEPMAETRGAEPAGDAYFGLYLWAMGTGRPRTCEALSDFLKQAGFSNIREHRTRQPLLVRVLSAKPSQ